MCKRCFQISYTVYDCLAIKDDGRIAVDAVLHSPGETDGRTLHTRPRLVVKNLNALYGEAFRLIGVGWEIYGEFYFDKLNPIQLVDL